MIRRARILRAVSFSIPLVIAVSFFSPPPAIADYDAAMTAYLNRDYVSAVSQFDRFVSRNASDSRVRSALYFSAVCRLNLSQPRPATARLRAILDAPPADAVSEPPPAMVRLALGIACRMMSDEAEAAKWIESAWLSTANPYERAAARDILKSSARVESPPPPPIRQTAVIRRIEWAVQVMSTRDIAQAADSSAALSNAGWTVYQETAVIRDESHFRVRVGPFDSEPSARAAKKKILALFGLDGWIVRR